MHLQIEKEVDFSRILPAGTFLNDYARKPDEFSKFFHFGPDQVDEKIASLHNQSFPHLKSLSEYLYDYHRGLQASPETLHNIAGLNNQTVIMTGQQPGLLTGPMYTIYKTISCISEAYRIQKRSGRSCAPVFWIASEDHNLEEATSIFWPDSQGGYRTLSIRPRRGHFKRPVGLLSLEGKKFISFVQELGKIFSGTPHSETIEQIIQSTLTRSVTLGEWFARLMLTLFGSSGLILLEPHDRRIKQLTRPIWEKILSDPLALPELVAQAGRELERCGYQPGLSYHSSRCPFFLYEDQQRERVMWDGRLFHTQNQDYSREQLQEILHLQPERFSPNVYVRPILSEFLFPTIMYLAGPGEMGYFAQIKGVYEYFGLKMPILMPRLSATLHGTESGTEYGTKYVTNILKDDYPQERKLNVFYLLNLYGLEFLKAIRELGIESYFCHYQIKISG